MEPIDLKWAANVLNARIIGDAEGFATSICTDTRNGAEGSLFFALAGDNADGHAYVQRAFDAGAVAAVVSKAVGGRTQLVVDDTLKALGDLARAYRRALTPDPSPKYGRGGLTDHEPEALARFEAGATVRREAACPPLPCTWGRGAEIDVSQDAAGGEGRPGGGGLSVVAVTGSVGKTSTKEMIAAVLARRHRTVANELNFNNEIGVPLTLFRLAHTDQVAVIEMGMRGAGQIDRLAEIAEPDVAVITGIGFAHIELLGSREAIAEAKSELLGRLPSDGIAVLPKDDEYFSLMASRVPPGARIVTFGGLKSYADIRVGRDERGAGIARCGDENVPFRIGAVGEHHFRNAGAAFAVAYVLGVPFEDAAAALECWVGVEGRMRVIPGLVDGVEVLDDCYNAGPESMELALTTLNSLTKYDRVAVLGDMLELGAYGPEIYRHVGRVAAEAELRLLVTVGELAAEIAEEVNRHCEATGLPLPEILACRDADDAASRVPERIEPGDVVLVKGSRGVHLETLVKALTGGASEYGHA